MRNSENIGHIVLGTVNVIFTERFPHPFKYSWGISHEYFPGWPEPTEEEIIRLYCFMLSSQILKLYVSQTKKMSQFQKQPPEVFYRKSCS